MNNIRQFYQEQDKISFWAITFTLLSIFMMVIPFFIFSVRLPNQLPLFYSLNWGARQLVEKPQFLLLPLLCGSILFINLFISWHLHMSQIHLKRILTVSTAIISLIFLTASVRIISLFI